MLSFIKKFFGAKPTVNPCLDTPYKVETPVAKVAEFPFPSVNPARTEKKPAVKKPAAKTKPVRKPRAPNA